MMLNFASFLWIKLRSYLLDIWRNLGQKWLEIFVSLIIIVGLVIGGYLLFLRAVHFLLEQGEMGQLLLDRIFYLGWSIIFYLLILSNIITAFSTLYHSPEVSFLITTPLPFLRIFRMKFVENLVYSSWAILILGLPLALAYGTVKSLTTPDILMILFAGLLPYLIIATALSLCIIMMVIWLSKWFKMRSIFLTLGIVFISFFWIYFNYSQQETLLTGNMAGFRVINRYLANLSGTPFPLIPSHWLSKLFISLSESSWWNFCFYSALFLSTALVGIEVSSFVAKRNYFSTFQMMEGTGTRKQGKSVQSPSWKPMTIYKGKTDNLRKVSSGEIKRKWSIRGLDWLTPQMRGLVLKDILQFVRTPQQWVQFLILGFCIGIYLINLSLADVRLGALSPFWRNALYLLNFGYSGFILAALTSRFVFPLISLEGESFWILLTSPLHLTKLFKEKFWLSFVILFGLAEVVALISNHYLSQSYYLTIISTIFLAMMSLALISISLGLGAVYPQFQERNPMKISSSAGGIITVVVSLFYVGVMVGTLVWISAHHERGLEDFRLVPVLLGILLFNVLFIALPLKWGHKALLRTTL